MLYLILCTLADVMQMLRHVYADCEWSMARNGKHQKNMSKKCHDCSEVEGPRLAWYANWRFFRGNGVNEPWRVGLLGK